MSDNDTVLLKSPKSRMIPFWLTESNHGIHAEKPKVDTDTNSIELHKSVTVDTLHNDEAVKVLANYVGDQSWEEEEEKRLRRKIDRKLLPILCLTYAVQYYDKSMLSQAAIFGLRTDLHLETGNRYSFTAAIFYLGFVAGAYPAIVMAQRFSIERVAFIIVFLWGICLTCTAACNNWQSIYAQRFFLGFLESGISPMFILVAGQFYKKNEQALRMGVWYCSTGYISVLSPLINYGLGHIKGALSPWRYMYPLAGSVTILWSAVILFYLPPDPIRARCFDERERYIAIARLRVNNAGGRNTHFKKELLFDLLRDAKFWIVFSMSFLIMIVNGPVSNFAPIIIGGLGFNTFTSLLLVMPAAFVGGTFQIVAPYIAYKVPNSRAYLIALCQTGTVIAALLLWLLPRDHTAGLLYGVYSLSCFGGSYAVLMGLQIANIAGYTKRSFGSCGLLVGYCFGNFVGPLLFKSKDAPSYTPAFAVVVVTSAVAGVLALVYRLICVWENKKRDKAGTMEGYDHAYDDDLTDTENPQFRYTL